MDRVPLCCSHPWDQQATGGILYMKHGAAVWCTDADANLGGSSDRYTCTNDNGRYPEKKGNSFGKQRRNHWCLVLNPDEDTKFWCLLPVPVNNWIFKFLIQHCNRPFFLHSVPPVTNRLGYPNISARRHQFTF